MREVFIEHEAEEAFDEDEMVVQLIEFRESLRTDYSVGRTLSEQLADAVAREQYELAAQLRDQSLSKKTHEKPRGGRLRSSFDIREAKRSMPAHRSCLFAGRTSVRYRGGLILWRRGRLPLSGLPLTPRPP